MKLARTSINYYYYICMLAINTFCFNAFRCFFFHFHFHLEAASNRLVLGPTVWWVAIATLARMRTVQTVRMPRLNSGIMIVPARWVCTGGVAGATTWWFPWWTTSCWWAACFHYNIFILDWELILVLIVGLSLVYLGIVFIV